MAGAGRKLIAGNWKMNGLSASLEQVRLVRAAVEQSALSADVVVCPPALLAVPAAAMLKGGPVDLGGQDCHAAASGAHTGDVSAEMWADAGARYVIVGHSERRADHGESDAAVKAKAAAVLRAGLTPIICLGESLEQRDAGETLGVVAGQLALSTPDLPEGQDMVLAYEPVWAIGSGRTPTPDQVREVHSQLRKGLTDRFGARAKGLRLLYGGSVKPDNAAQLLAIADVDGALVGGASLKATDFLAIARAAAPSR